MGKAGPEAGFPPSPSLFATQQPRFNHKTDVFKKHNENRDTMCINKSTASGLPVQDVSWHSGHSEIPGPEPITTAIGFAYLISVTVSTVKNTLQRKGNSLSQQALFYIFGCCYS